MRNFNQGGGRRFGSDRGERGSVQMHRAICSKCNKACEVPFRPTGDKPIYCNDCFGANRDRGDARGRERGGDRFPRRDFGSRPNNDEVKKQLEFLGLKIDRLTKIVESLTSPKASSYKEKNTEVKEVLQDLSVIKKTKTKVPAKKVAKKKSVKKV